MLSRHRCLIAYRIACHSAGGDGPVGRDDICEGAGEDEEGACAERYATDNRAGRAHELVRRESNHIETCVDISEYTYI